jgi:hypothetical protein
MGNTPIKGNSVDSRPVLTGIFSGIPRRHLAFPLLQSASNPFFTYRFAMQPVALA